VKGADNVKEKQVKENQMKETVYQQQANKKGHILVS